MLLPDEAYATLHLSIKLEANDEPAPVRSAACAVGINKTLEISVAMMSLIFILISIL
jgi:hypothetical protein